jgi:hypothetical protein
MAYTAAEVTMSRPNCANALLTTVVTFSAYKIKRPIQINFD